MQTDEQSPVVALRRMILGYRLSQALRVAAELGIADLLKDGPRNVDELAQATGAHPPSLYRLLRLLASDGVFIEQEQGQFGLTPWPSRCSAMRRLHSASARSLMVRKVTGAPGVNSGTVS
jgi:hypothetical protein